MFRQSLRRCAPLRASVFSAAAVRVPFQARIAERSIKGFVATLPAPNRSFHHTRQLGQEAAIAEDASSAQPSSVQDAQGGQSGPKPFRSLVNEGVHPALIRAIVEGMGFANMTEVQEKTLQAALQGKDLVAQAKTGTGKTLAFLIPIIQRMLDECPDLAQRRAAYNARPNDIRGIIISPTRELAEQIAVEAKNLARHTGIMVHTAVGGSSKRSMLRDLQRRGCHLLVATPGRLLDLLEDSTSGVEAPHLAAVVLDEADRILDVGFAKELDGIMRRLPDPTVKERQTLLFSATIPKSVVGLTRKMVRRDQFEFVQTIRPDEELTHEKVPQKIAVAKAVSNIWPTLYELMDREVEKAAQNDAAPFKAIVYLPTTSMVQVAADVDYLLRRHRTLQNNASRIPGFHIHGRLTQERRTSASDNFRRAKTAILFSSDVTARGMDFPNVSHVIQVGLPPGREQYIHRLGRTGRQDKSGEGWLLITDNEMPGARSDLAGLPITPDTTLINARSDIDGSPTPHIEEVKKAFSRVHRRVLADAYQSSFGQIDRKLAQRLLLEMNDFTRDIWGWQKPPAVSERSMHKRGLAGLQGWNFNDSPASYGEEQESDDPFQDFVSRADGNRSGAGRSYERGFGGGRDRGFGGGRDRGFGGDRDRGFGGGRDRGFGGGRDRSFGGDRDRSFGGGRGGGGGWGRASAGEDFGRANF